MSAREPSHGIEGMTRNYRTAGGPDTSLRSRAALQGDRLEPSPVRPREPLAPSPGPPLVGAQSRLARDPIVGFSLVEFVAPVVPGLTVVRIRRAGWFKSLTKALTRLDSRERAWDFASSSHVPFFVRAKLKSGERVGGLYGDDSFASAFPRTSGRFP